MTYPVLGRTDEALTPAETEQFLRDRIGDALVATTDEYGTFTVTVTSDAWVETARLCKHESLLAYDMFDSLFGVDRGDDGFDVVAVLYSTSRGRRILLRTRADGGRDNPTCPTLTELYPGANWMERETWDMFGIDFEGHPGIAPRILTVENFEGWPLRKDFYLASRAAKPWPGVKEPAETDDEGNVIVKVPGPGEAPGPSVLDEVLAAQSKTANPAPEPEPGELETAKPAAETEGEHHEVEIDQETYDRLIAEGKSERIARSKAKAAHVKKQRQAEAAAGAGGAMAAGPASGDQVAAAASDAPPPSDADRVAADMESATEDAEVKAEQVRKAQAEARAEKAAEQAADGPVAADADAPEVPEGMPPADDESEGQGS